MKTLQESLNEYIDMKKSLGFKVDVINRNLQSFLQFMDDNGVNIITIDIAVRWARIPSSAKPSWWAQRLGFVRGFARYQCALDNISVVPPPGLLPFRSKRASPYIYTNDEISRLLKASLAIRSVHGVKHRTYHLLLGLLAVTGMRIGEILRLNVNSVDLTDDTIKVLNSKGGKSRIVPLHYTTTVAIKEYITKYRILIEGTCDDTLLLNDYGRRISMYDIHTTFNQLTKTTGLRNVGAKYGPRLHDFRHRFAIETLLRWYRRGDDVESKIPLLSTYLGHAAVRSTYWYLSATPELLNMATKRIEDRWESMS